jgi:hypothetical protein
MDRKLAQALYGRGIARLRRGDQAGGWSDISAAQNIQPGIQTQFARYGVTPPAQQAPPPTAKPPAPPPPPPPVATAPKPPASAAADCSGAETHWKSVLQIDLIGGYEDHVKRFPACNFATLAKVKIDALRKKP